MDLTSTPRLPGGHPAAQPAVLVVTGASGAGKTTLVRALAGLGLAGVGCYHFDDIGVPSAEEMARRFGDGARWQAWATDAWAARLLRNADGVAVAVLDGQVRPAVALSALRHAGARRAQVVLADCGHAERNARLRGPRGQPELATPEMDCWAAYLRGQADALALPVLDTGHASPAGAVSELVTHVLALGAGAAGAPRPGAA